MPIVFDPAKNERNIAERGLSFERVADLDRGSALMPRTTDGITANGGSGCSGGWMGDFTSRS